LEASSVRAECIQSESERIFALIENTATDLAAVAKKIDFSRLEPEQAQQTREALQGLAAASKACRDPQSVDPDCHAHSYGGLY
jgi:hypothetical protein